MSTTCCGDWMDNGIRGEQMVLCIVYVSFLWSHDVLNAENISGDLVAQKQFYLVESRVACKKRKPSVESKTRSSYLGTALDATTGVNEV